MGRHSLPDSHAAEGRRGHPSTRRRTVAIATLLVLAVATGTAVAAKGGLLSFSESCEDSAVRLSVVASPDIAPAVRSIAEQARADEVKADGHCLVVEVLARDAHKVAEALAAGDTEPDFQVWLPDSDLWLERAKGLGEGIPVSPSDSVASSPVALAMVPSASRALGWPRKTYTWAELVAGALGSDRVRLGAADPARSATGLLALAGIGASSARQGGDSDTRVAQTAKVLAERMSDGDTQVLETLARSTSGAEEGNPKRNQAALISEQTAFTHNAEATGAGKLDLFYPEDGTPLLDYPYTLVNEARLSTAESRAALRFMNLLGDRDAQATFAEHGFRAGDGSAEDSLVAAAGGRKPQPYAEPAVEAPSDEELQETLGMWTITVQSARLTTVVDASGSMATLVPGRNQSRMNVTKESLIQALDQFTPDDEIGLWKFATTLDGEKDCRRLMETKRLGDPAAGGGTHREKLTAAFAALQPVPGGATGLYDTTLASYKEARSTYVKGKFNALVILTDGSNQDTDGISRSGLVTELKELVDPERPVPVIAIAVGPDADRDEVAEIARITGGDGYEVSDPAEIQAVILQAIMAAGQNGRAAEE
ncbi:substrate-binding and VWA domain-containing protein [Streptomyces globisporus]|uniref:substrate-binding and VWA domain-containing protein n=1 Tax=Streptomyces albovinaceus subgroup TaxID=1482558 RepID=UPI000E2DA804|nr:MULTISPECIES: substrate-binding and VWA domain-containing protein [Streptomyces]RDL04239.1 von Willebrand factor type A domain-containing protein [Streptomyces sp. HB202]